MTDPGFGKAVDYAFASTLTVCKLSKSGGIWPEDEQDVIELHQNAVPGGKVDHKESPGRLNAGEVTHTRSVTSDSSFDQWARDTRSREMNDNARKGGASVALGLLIHSISKLHRFVLRAGDSLGQVATNSVSLLE